MKLWWIDTSILLFLAVKMTWEPAVNGKKTNISCPSTGFRISVLELPPYVIRSVGTEEPMGIVGDFFYEIFKKCIVDMCPDLTLRNLTFVMFNSTEALYSWISDNKTDLAFPINRPLHMALTDDSYTGPPLKFGKIISSPAYSLIRDLKIYNNEAKTRAFYSLFESTWPIVLFTVLIAGISGVIVWILETYHNEEEFPRSFTLGSYEGFWWAFVSMTTVGYGDKTPKFVLGRLFGVFWILTGLVVIALFTATATGALSISSAGVPGMQGKRVGVLNNSSAELVAKQNGAIVKVSAPFDELYYALKEKHIAGILMDSYRAAYYLDLKNDPDLRVFQTVNSGIEYDFAVPRRDSHLLESETCVGEHLETLHIDGLLMQYLRPVEAYHPGADSENLISGNSRTTQQLLLFTTCVFFGLIIIGAIAELVYKKVWKKKKKIHDGKDDISLKEIRVHPDTMRNNLKDVQDKLSQLICEVSRLQEQVSVIATQANVTMGYEQTTGHM